MPFTKIGEAFVIGAEDIQSAAMIPSTKEIDDIFQKFATELKLIAPKANDFIYFTTIMMHAAEAALLNPDGTLRKDSKGKDVSAKWEKTGDSMKWVCSDPTIMPLKNANRDIFPEEELIKAYKKWAGKPLCVDHKSDSIEFVRGIVLDTYYDYPNKRVVAVCALDKKNYPDLAHKVTSGYASSVSMGTLVARAVCTDCGTVARTERDFCSCMRSKSSYGEINCDLNPLELSIVVTPADKNAKIRRVLAAVDSLDKYISAKNVEITEFKPGDTQTKLSQFNKDLDDVLVNFLTLKHAFKNLQTEMQENDNHQKDSSTELKAVASEDGITLSAVSEQMNKISNKLSELFNINEVLNMSNKKAFYQGGGGVNEPELGKVKYPKDDSDSIRDKEDAQMRGQNPFPGVGNVDGLHPSPESVSEKDELKRKEMLRRAQEDERKLRRQALLKSAVENINRTKQSYWQGGGGVNEPTPGKTKYPGDDAESIRNKEDAQMKGQSPFPGVGNVDGLHPSPESVAEKDELKRKEMLRRAGKMTASFQKAANADGSHNLGASYWRVLANGNQIFSATVDEITNGRAEMLYDSVRSEAFAKNLLAQIRAEGVEKVASQLKATAQAAPMPAMPAAADMGAPAHDEPADKGGDGDPSKNLPELLDQAENVLSDIRKGVDVLTDKSSNELDSLEKLGPAKGISPAVASAINVQRKIRATLTKGMKQAAGDLATQVEQLKMAQHIHSHPEKLARANTSQDYLNSLTNETVDATRKVIADSYKLMTIFSKYAQGTENIMKRASKDLQLFKAAQDAPASSMDPMVLRAPSPGVKPVAAPAAPKLTPQAAQAAPASSMDPLNETIAPSPGVKPVAIVPEHKLTPKPVAAPAAPKLTPQQEMEQLEKARGDRSGLTNMLINNTPAVLRNPQAAPPSGQENVVDVHHAKDEEAKDEAKDSNDVKMMPDGSVEGTADEVGKVLHDKKAAAALRAKLAEKGLQYYSMLDEAHKGLKDPASVANLKPGTPDGGKVETVEEVQEKMLAAVSPKNKKTAEEIQGLILRGAIKAEDVDSLVAEGVDKDAVAYWKGMWGQLKDKDSKEFANDLLKEHYEAKLAAALQVERVKLARSYELAHDMVRKNAIPESKSAIEAQVKDLMNLNDVGFNQLKRTIDGLPAKQAFSLPRVGMNDDVVMPETAKPASTVSSLADEYAQLFPVRRR